MPQRYTNNPFQGKRLRRNRSTSNFSLITRNTSKVELGNARRKSSPAQIAGRLAPDTVCENAVDFEYQSASTLGNVYPQVTEDHYRYVSDYSLDEQPVASSSRDIFHTGPAVSAYRTPEGHATSDSSINCGYLHGTTPEAEATSPPPRVSAELSHFNSLSMSEQQASFNATTPLGVSDCAQYAPDGGHLHPNSIYAHSQHISPNRRSSQSDRSPHSRTSSQRSSRSNSHVAQSNGVLDKNDQGRYDCPECDKNYQDTSSLKRHLRSHLSCAQMICPLCSRQVDYEAPEEVLGGFNWPRWKCLHCSAFLHTSQIIDHFTALHYYCLSCTDMVIILRPEDATSRTGHFGKKKDPGHAVLKQFIHENRSSMTVEDPDLDVVRQCDHCDKELTGLLELVRHREALVRNHVSLPSAALGYTRKIRGHLQSPRWNDLWTMLIQRHGFPAGSEGLWRWDYNGEWPSMLLRGLELVDRSDASLTPWQLVHLAFRLAQPDERLNHPDQAMDCGDGHK